MNRGDRREPIFKDDHDRRRFLQTLAQTCEKTGWQVHAYCLIKKGSVKTIDTNALFKQSAGPCRANCESNTRALFTTS